MGVGKLAAFARPCSRLWGCKVSARASEMEHIAPKFRV